MHPANVRRSRCAERYGVPSRQSGYAMLLALVLLVLGSLYGLMQGLSEATAQNRREDHDQSVLQQARDALIAYAALRPTRPGALPCPDLDDNGIMGGTHPTNVAWNVPEPFGTACDVPQNRTGRLPWATLDLPELRDSSGERLWYALSNNFRNIAANRINSDTRGQLTLTGLAPQNEVIAVVFAPGAALGIGGVAQDRSAAGRNIAANFLEGENGDTTNDVFATLTSCVSADCPGGPFNDKVMVIRASDLFPVVESLVARRLQTELRNAIFREGATFTEKGHYQRWRDHAGVSGQGYFPYASAFVQPDTSSFRGTWSAHDGLMPVTSEPTFVRWELVDPTYDPRLVEETPGSNVLNAASACDPSTGDQIVCEVRYGNFTTPRIRITGHALNVALSYVDPVQNGDVVVDRWSAFFGMWVPGGGTLQPPVTNTHLASGLAGSARAEVVVNLAARSSSDTSPTRIRIPKPPYNTAIVGPSWFTDNDWQRVTLYSVAPAATSDTTLFPKDATTGNPDCGIANAGCRDALSTLNGGTNRHLVLLLAGLPVDNNLPRPAAGLDRYLEGRNVWTNVAAHTPLHQFETFRAGRDRTNLVSGNDRLAVMAP